MEEIAVHCLQQPSKALPPRNIRHWEEGAFSVAGQEKTFSSMDKKAYISIGLYKTIKKQTYKYIKI